MFGGGSDYRPVTSAAADAAANKPAKKSDPAVQQAIAEASRRRAAKRGYKSTILSSMFDESNPTLKASLGS